ncbi:MAG: biopolymer transporter ExbD [Verrucomicrobiota bacterium]
MKFYEPRRNTPSIPIVSLIDILTILLIYFIVTMSPKEKKALLNISLPKSSQMSGETVMDRRVTIAVSADEEVFIDDRAVALKDLASELILLKQENPEVKLELKADEKLPLGILVGVWDAFNAAGIAIKDVPARILLQN